MKLNILKIHQENENRKYEEERQKQIAEEKARYEAMTDEEKAEYDKQKEAKRKQIRELLSFPAYASALLHQKPYNK